MVNPETDHSPKLEVLNFGNLQLIVGIIRSHGSYIYKYDLLGRSILRYRLRGAEGTADFCVVVTSLVAVDTKQNLTFRIKPAFKKIHTVECNALEKNIYLNTNYPSCTSWDHKSTWPSTLQNPGF